MFLCQLLLTLCSQGWIHRLPMGQGFACLILSHQRLRLHSPAPAWHVDQLILPISNRKVLKMHIYIYMCKCQTGVEVLSSPQTSPFFSIFQGGLERFRGISLRFIFLLLSTLSPSKTPSPPKTVSRQSALPLNPRGNTSRGWKVQQCRVDKEW